VIVGSSKKRETATSAVKKNEDEGSGRAENRWVDLKILVNEGVADGE